MSQRAKLRVCASCEWIFKLKPRTPLGTTGCPRCGFAHYSAHYVYGKKAYAYSETQQPWRDKKLANYACKLDEKIRQWKKDHEKG